MTDKNEKIPVKVYNDDHHYDSFGKPIVDEMYSIRTDARSANVEAIIEAMKIFKHDKK